MKDVDSGLDRMLIGAIGCNFITSTHKPTQTREVVLRGAGSGEAALFLFTIALQLRG